MVAKKILITGISKGLGRALLERFYEEGHTVIGCARSQSSIHQLKVQFENSYFDVVDVADSRAVDKWSEQVLSEVGAPDLVINNASIINHPAPLWDISPNEFDSVVKINIEGCFNVIRYFVPSMVERGSGIIVNLSSGWGRHGGAFFGPYCASKFAVEGMTQSLAEELPKGMCVIAFSPGVVNTDMLNVASPDTAHLAPSPNDAAKKMAPFFLSLDERSNGKSIDISQIR